MQLLTGHGKPKRKYKAVMSHDNVDLRWNTAKVTDNFSIIFIRDFLLVLVIWYCQDWSSIFSFTPCKKIKSELVQNQETVDLSCHTRIKL